MRQVLPGIEPAKPLVRFFGDYELIEEIAHGGMGIVYRARQMVVQAGKQIGIDRSGPPDNGTPIAFECDTEEIAGQ